MANADYSNLPRFDELPGLEGMPAGCAWGVFDRDGKKDHLGCINLLTPPVVQAALREAQNGESVSLNWPINALQTPAFGRAGLQHRVISFQDKEDEHHRLHGFDDEVTFNTQCSSQWDSLVHYAHQHSQLSYNGVRPSVQTLEQSSTPFAVDHSLPTLNHWHKRGGIVARGVLLDYKAYADVHGIKYSPFEGHAITVDDLEAVTKWENVSLRQGDILIVRSGYTRALQEMSPETQQEALKGGRAVGVKGCSETARWVWDHHFAGVAGDALAFEQLPPIKEDKSEGGIADLVLHQYFLSLFGLNIGELWDLEALSRTCASKKKYSFLLTSCPLNVPGGVGSPPNALAIF
ncbi:uncharacterized protein PFLUO_LOCUS9362 [Penicillium psychrofluorescens]|uniref:uncharacterized protein n=1 Tax=Penicillium psychrofluorescens TaxID=3158075 RepID=UPI003CCD4023